MGEQIKSSYEIAMARLEGLPEFTEEERREQQEQELAPRGTALAIRFLAMSLTGEKLQRELGRFADDQRVIVKHGCQAALSQALLVTDLNQSKLALEGLSAITPAFPLQRLQTALEEAARGFQEERLRLAEGFSQNERARFQELWISGTAVQPNLSGNEQWLAKLDALQARHDSQLQELVSNA